MSGQQIVVICLLLAGTVLGLDTDIRCPEEVSNNDDGIFPWTSMDFTDSEPTTRLEPKFGNIGEWGEA